MEGICHICGYRKKLSFEHVPPRSAFNDRSVVFHKIEEIMTKLPDEFGRGKILQKGSGSYTLCEKCNNDTGAWYGNAFASFAHQGMEILRLTEKTPTLFYNFFIYPLRTLKQIMCLFFSTNGPDFQSKHPELVKFVLNKEERYLESDVKIYLFYNLSKVVRKTGIVGVMSLEGDDKLFSEITFPPYGYVMNFNKKPPDERLLDITSFKDYEYNSWTSLHLKIPVFSIYTQFPGDYRCEEEVKKIIAENRAKASNAI